MATGLLVGLENLIRGVPQAAQGVGNTVANAVTGLPGAAEGVGKDIASGFGYPTPQESSGLGATGDVLRALYNPAGGSPTPAPTNTPSAPTSTQSLKQVDPLTYQQLVSAAISPLVKNFGSDTQQQLKSQLAPYSSQYPSGTVASGISSTMQSMIGDYKTGLTAMMNSATQATPLQAEIKGMEEVLAYPQAASSLTNAGAPQAIAGSSFLDTIYQALSQERAGLPPASTTSGQGYNSSVNSLLSG